MKKIALSSLVCALLALGLTGCPAPTDTAASTGNGGTSNGTN